MYSQGNNDEALKLYDRALRIYEPKYGHNNLLVSATVANIAQIY